MKRNRSCKVDTVFQNANKKRDSNKANLDQDEATSPVSKQPRLSGDTPPSQSLSNHLSSTVWVCASSANHGASLSSLLYCHHVALIQPIRKLPVVTVYCCVNYYVRSCVCACVFGQNVIHLTTWCDCLIICANLIIYINELSTESLSWVER